jgi:hypothetical protein
MSPVPVAIREERGVRTAPVPLPPPIELLRGPLREMVVDWQLPTDGDRQ